MMVEYDAISDRSNLDNGSGIGKIAVEEVEQVNADPQKPANNDHMPEILRYLSEQEREDLNLRLRKKIDLRLLPMMLLMYIMNYLVSWLSRESRPSPSCSTKLLQHINNNEHVGPQQHCFRSTRRP
jgi:hypothetical protein